MTRPAASSPEVVVRASGFVKRYKQHLAVDRLDLTVKRGEIYGLIGPDGAGKSSVMKAIAGVLRLNCGNLFECFLKPFAHFANKNGAPAINNAAVSSPLSIFSAVSGSGTFFPFRFSIFNAAGTSFCRSRNVCRTISKLVASSIFSQFVPLRLLLRIISKLPSASTIKSFDSITPQGAMPPG